MKYIFSLLLFFFLPQVLKAQQSPGYSEKEYAKNPVWIQMMDDTLSNYFEVEKAYAIYWQHHQMPVAEDEFEGKRGKDKDEKYEKATLQEMREKNDMAAAIKAYKLWHMQMLPFVQDDGRILTPTEQVAAWRHQQDQLKQQAKN